MARLTSAARRRLDAALRRLRGAGVKARALLLTGTPWRVILEQAEAAGADLLVLGTQGVSKGKKLYVGTTSHHVFFGSRIPILTAP